MAGTNKIKVFSLAIFSMLIFSLTFVAAQATQSILWCSMEECLGKFSSFLNLVFGFPKDQSIGILIIAVFIFLVIAFGIIDILSLTAPFFSRRTHYLIGFGLAFIAAFSRMLVYFTIWLFRLAAAMGTIAVIFEIILAFAIFMGLAWCSEKAFAWALRRKVKMKALKEVEEPAEAWRKLKEFEKATKE
jgi:hypothetical protein